MLTYIIKHFRTSGYRVNNNARYNFKNVDAIKKFAHLCTTCVVPATFITVTVKTTCFFFTWFNLLMFVKRIELRGLVK